MSPRWLKICSALATVMMALACMDLLLVMVCMQVEALQPATMSFILGGGGCALSAIFFDALAQPTEDDDGR